MNRIETVGLFLAGFLCLNATVGAEEQTAKPFTVADDIELALFPAGLGDSGRSLRFSPDGNYFAVYCERGRLDLNRPEDSLRFYRTQEVQEFLNNSEQLEPPSPVWAITRSIDKEGPTIVNDFVNDWRWLADSSGVAFVERTAGGDLQLFLADLGRKTVKALTSTSEKVQAFDIRDLNHFVYIAREGEQPQPEREVPAIVGTDRSIRELLFPSRSPNSRSRLWAVIGGKRFEVKNDREPLSSLGGEGLALSPDGRSLIAILPVPEVPSSWETLYPPPFASSAYRIRAGHGSANEYVRINLQTGSIQSLTDAPISSDGGWWAYGKPSWSSDGQEILLPGTFLRSKDQKPSRPCVAVVDLTANTPSCVEVLKGHSESGVEEGYHRVDGARFVGGDHHRVMVIFTSHEDDSAATTEYRRAPAGAWQIVGQSEGLPEIGPAALVVTVKQGLNQPPLLVASFKEESRVIWDPNPQLKNVELGQASVYTWKDRDRRNWRGGLYLPAGYESGRRYPLVIQTHGFDESRFSPSGAFPTAFAASELSAVGIVVLQVAEPCPAATPNEGACAVSGYESAVSHLVSEGLVDPEKIGIIGFSRTCFYVMETLTTSPLRLKAASITDGWIVSYFQYMQNPERFSTEADSMIGAPPFGEGLPQWLKRSPGFNLDRVTIPLLVVAEGQHSLLFMWEPYAALHYLKRPVDLIMLNTDEHVLTNPAVRMVSQGGSVDWFRFWLQDYQDPDPAKAEQYARWRELRKLQEQNEARPQAAPAR